MGGESLPDPPHPSPFVQTGDKGNRCLETWVTDIKWHIHRTGGGICRGKRLPECLSESNLSAWPGRQKVTWPRFVVGLASAEESATNGWSGTTWKEFRVFKTDPDGPKPARSELQIPWKKRSWPCAKSMLRGEDAKSEHVFRRWVGKTFPRRVPSRRSSGAMVVLIRRNRRNIRLGIALKRKRPMRCGKWISRGILKRPRDGATR